MNAWWLPPPSNKYALGLCRVIGGYVMIMNGLMTVATSRLSMAARDRPTLGIAHLTVVPRNFEPESDDAEEVEREPESTR